MAFIQERQQVPIGRDPLWARQEIRPNCRVLHPAEKATAFQTVNLSKRLVGIIAVFVGK